MDDESRDLKDGSIKQEKNVSASPGDKKDILTCATGSNLKMERDVKDVQKAKDSKTTESELVRDLKAQLK